MTDLSNLISSLPLLVPPKKTHPPKFGKIDNFSVMRIKANLLLLYSYSINCCLIVSSRELAKITISFALDHKKRAVVSVNFY